MPLQTAEQIANIVRVHLERVRIPDVGEFLRRHLVPPILHYRRWDYSPRPVRYPCWLIADFRRNDIGIVYSEYGHGKHDPWGAVGITDKWYGRDDRWFLTIEDAVINSGCWDGPLPDDYEIA